MSLKTFTDGDTLNADGGSWFQKNVVNNPLVNPFKGMQLVGNALKDVRNTGKIGGSSVGQTNVPTQEDVNSVISALNNPTPDASRDAGATPEKSGIPMAYKVVGGFVLTAVVVTTAIVLIRRARKK